MKKSKMIISVTVIILTILLFPIKLVRNDGGTKEYRAILYTVIDWHELRIRYNEETCEEESYIARDDIEIIIFPKNWKKSD